jgi:capsid portal protein
MKSIQTDDIDSEAIIVGDDLQSEILRKFSLKEKESDENKEVIKKHIATWKTQYCRWRNAEEIKAKAFEAKKKKDIEELTTHFNVMKSMDKPEDMLKNIQKQIDDVTKGYYNPTNPPFPASDVTIQTQADYLASGEYIPKPYDVEAMTELIEGNQRLKSSVIVNARNSVGLGTIYRPTLGRNVADFTEEELTQYHAQGKELLKWYNSRAERGKYFYQLAYEVEYGKGGLGEGYFEVTETRKGDIAKINVINSTYIFEGVNRDRYIWIKNGKKKYFKRFDDKTIRNSEDFSTGGPFEKRATRLVPFKEYNLMSDVYGVSNWTGAIPQIIGARYAAERNTNFFLNDATPRLVITVAGGAVDVATKEAIKKYFQVKGKGRENAGRVMVLCVSSKNQLSPNVKPPTVTFEPLTVGVTDDASFMKYQAGCEETIREAFRISNTFYGNADGTNRASAFTLRDQVVRTVFIPEGELMTNLCNDFFTYDFGREKGYVTLDEKGNETKNDLLAELAFRALSTMSQKDEQELAVAQLTAGALSIDDFRAEVLGMSKLNTWFSKIPRTLAISCLQLAETSPALVGLTIDSPEYDAAIAQDRADDIANGKIDTNAVVVDDTVKAIHALRRGLQQVLGHEHVSKETLGMLDKYYSNVAELVAEDNEIIKNLFAHKEEQE